MADKEEQAAARVSDNWFNDHLASVPIGTFIVTWALMLSTTGAWQWWSSEEDLKLGGQVAPFGAAVYGVLMLLAERVGRKLWIRFRRIRAIAKAREEGYEKGYTEGYEEGLRAR